MSKFILISLSFFITSCYTLIIFLSFDGFNRNSFINIFLNKFTISNPSYYFVILILIAISLNIIFFILINGLSNYNLILKNIITSFLIGVIITISVVTSPNLPHVLYDKYILLFYDNVYYDGEERTEQVFSFIARLLTFSFIIGGVFSMLIFKLKIRKPVK